MIGLAYRGCCISMLGWAYRPEGWPRDQVHLIEELVCRLATVMPPGVKALLEADRGIGTSAELVKGVQALDWYYVLRVQGQTRVQLADGSEGALGERVSRGGQWTQPGKVFKPAG